MCTLTCINTSLLQQEDVTVTLVHSCPLFLISGITEVLEAFIYASQQFFSNSMHVDMRLMAKPNRQITMFIYTLPPECFPVCNDGKNTLVTANINRILPCRTVHLAKFAVLSLKTYLICVHGLFRMAAYLG